MSKANKELEYIVEKERLISSAKEVITKYLATHFYKTYWCVAGGFVRDYLLGVAPRDVDFFIKAEYQLSDSVVLNSNGTGTWRQVNLLEYASKRKHITCILRNDVKNIDIVYLDWSGTFEKYIDLYFDASISKVFWSPETGINLPELTYQDMESKIIHYSPNVLPSYIHKLEKKFPTFMKVIDRPT